jgi:uncharacterized repeat protein (TIGR01451 family)
MHQQFYFIKFLFISLLLSMGIGNTVSGQTFYINLSQQNMSTGQSGNAITASYGQIMLYSIGIENWLGSEITNSTVVAPIPGGTSYVPGSTKVNGVPVSDVNGKMPFSGSGGLINTPGSAPGVIASSEENIFAQIEYSVKVTATVGNITNNATLDAWNGEIIRNSTVSALLDPGSCNTIYQSTASTPIGTIYNYIRTLNTTNGTAGATIFTPSGPCYNIVNGVPVSTTPGTVLTDAQAIAFDLNSNRIYFINKTTNNPAQELCYIDLNSSPVAAYKYVGYPLETNTAAGYNIDRMTFASDGFGYALTTNGQDLIRFSVDPATNLPVISRLGSLINDVNNGVDVLTGTGGDMFADASGKLYLLSNNPTPALARTLYRINPATRVATGLHQIIGIPTAAAMATNAVAIDAAGNLYTGGAYQNVYKVDLFDMIGSSITSGTSNVFKTGDYTSCAFPAMAPELNVTKTYANLTGSPTVRAGDDIEFKITITNTGNISAANVKLYDAIPANCHYIANSTTITSTTGTLAVPDISGSMPFSVSGGYLINGYPAWGGNGVVRPDVDYQIKFRVAADEYVTVCNQALITFIDADGNTINLYSDDPNRGGAQDATCFNTDKGTVGMIAEKTYTDLNPNNVGVIAGDEIEYIIKVINTGTYTATGVKIYDAIPPYSHYVPNSTVMNYLPVADINGQMPFAVNGGQLINTAGQPAGVVKPGSEYVGFSFIKFRVTTDPLRYVCNQATINLTANGNTINIVSDDPTQPGASDATCFYSDGVLGSGRKAVSGITENEQPAIIESVHVQPNPFINDLNLQVQSNTEKAVQVRLIDFYGRTVFTTSQKLAKGTNSLKLPGTSH